MGKKKAEKPAQKIDERAKSLEIGATDYILVSANSTTKLIRIRELQKSHKIICWQKETGGGWKRPPEER